MFSSNKNERHLNVEQNNNNNNNDLNALKLIVTNQFINVGTKRVIIND